MAREEKERGDDEYHKVEVDKVFNAQFKKR